MASISLLGLNKSLLHALDLINHFILTINALHSTAEDAARRIVRPDLRRWTALLVDGYPKTGGLVR